MPKATKITKTRRYKVTKRHPRRPIALMRMDLGNVEQQIALHFPENTKIINVEIPKEKNPNLFTIYFSKIKICWYFDEEKGFIFDENGIYLGNFEKHDLKKLFAKTGSLLKASKNKRRKLFSKNLENEDLKRFFSKNEPIKSQKKIETDN